MLRSIAASLLFWTALPAPAVDTLSARELDAVPLQVLPTNDLARVLATMPAASDRGPLVVAARVAVDWGLDRGIWTIEPGGSTAVWRLRLYSPGASLLIVSFERFDLPDGATLHAMNAGGGDVRGPYTRAHRNARGGLTLPYVPGEETLLELRVPRALRDDVSVRLRSLSHGVHPLDTHGLPQPKSGSCNIDVVCAQGDPWRDQIRSTVALLIPASAFFDVLCSGQLMNNTAEDGRPLVLTASHCGASAVNDQDIVAIFNFQTSTCGGVPNGSVRDSITGTQFLDDHSRSDFSLLELDQRPPASFQVYYSGFNANPAVTPQNGVSIHHPSGDEKRISVFTQAPARETLTLQGGQIVDSFRVRWAQGTTETGSSGAGLWNEQRQLVGILSGGDASCANVAGSDYFGRLDLAWENGLRVHLDPANTGRLDLCGTNPGSPCNLVPVQFTRVFIHPGMRFTALDSSTEVFGSSATETLRIGASAVSVIANANLEIVEFVASVSVYRFEVQGNVTLVWENGRVVATITVQDDANGTRLRFADGSASLSISGLDKVFLGGVALTTADGGAPITPTQMGAAFNPADPSTIR